MRKIEMSRHDRQMMEKLEVPFRESRAVKTGAALLSTDRMKASFRNYLVRGEPFKGGGKKSRAFALEGKPLTKTEREYFYRVVKKKLRALANEDLHQLARQMSAK